MKNHGLSVTIRHLGPTKDGLGQKIGIRFGNGREFRTPCYASPFDAVQIIPDFMREPLSPSAGDAHPAARRKLKGIPARTTKASRPGSDKRAD